jgi:predicted porin
MNKKILASAVGAALVAGAGLAQADVKVYGIVQADWVHVTNSNNYKTEQVDDVGQSRIGFDAVEDLGGGLKGLARIELGTNPVESILPSGSASTQYGLSSRLHWVGLGSKFGSIKLGTFDSAYKQTGGTKWDPFVATSFEARNNGGMSSSAYGHTTYVNNAIEYASPEFYGLTFIGQTIRDDSDTTAQNGTTSTATASSGQGNKDYSVSLKWKKGPIELIAAKSKDANGRANVNTVAANSNTNKASTLTKFGAQFSMANHTISFQREYDKNDTNSPSLSGLSANAGLVTATNPNVGTGSTGSTRNGTLTFIGYQFKVANEVIVAQIGEQNYNEHASETNNAGVTEVNSADSHYRAFGVIHMFSKTTRAYLGYRQTNNDQGTYTGTNQALVSNTAKIRVIGGGMRVDF